MIAHLVLMLVIDVLIWNEYGWLPAIIFTALTAPFFWYLNSSLNRPRIVPVSEDEEAPKRLIKFKLTKGGGEFSIQIKLEARGERGKLILNQTGNTTYWESVIRFMPEPTGSPIYDALKLQANLEEAVVAFNERLHNGLCKSELKAQICVVPLLA